MKSAAQIQHEVDALGPKIKLAKDVLDKYIAEKQNEVYIRLAARRVNDLESRLEALRWALADA